MQSLGTLAHDFTAPLPLADRRQIMDLLDDFSIELTPGQIRPTAAQHCDLGGLLPAGTRVYITFVPGEDWRNVASTARQLRDENLTPVPHFPARSIPSRSDLEAFLRQVTDQAGVDEVLVVGGGVDRPQGPFSGTLALLETGLFERYGIRTIGLTGHPEGQPVLSLPGVTMSQEQKLDYAARSAAKVRLVTQFVFDAAPLLAWEGAIRTHDSLPIHVGVPGPATVKTLLKYARMCGIGNSMRALTRQGGNLLRLARLAHPDALVTALARQRAADPASRIERLHFYPFGGLARTARWIDAVRSGAFTLHDDGAGFTVDAHD